MTTIDERPVPIEPAYLAPGYVAGYANYHAIKAWGITPAVALRRWHKKRNRELKKEARIDNTPGAMR